MSAANLDGLVCLGVIASPHGVRGEVNIKPFTESPDGLTAYGQPCFADGKPANIKIRSIGNTTVIATIEGVNDRNAADILKGQRLYIARNQLPKTSQNEYYIGDLEGAAVELQDGSEFGFVTGVHNYGAGTLLEIFVKSLEKPEFFAFTTLTFPQVDVAGKRITICPPDLVVSEEKSDV